MSLIRPAISCLIPIARIGRSSVSWPPSCPSRYQLPSSLSAIRFISRALPLSPALIQVDRYIHVPNTHTRYSIYGLHQWRHTWYLKLMWRQIERRSPTGESPQFRDFGIRHPEDQFLGIAIMQTIYLYPRTFAICREMYAAYSSRALVISKITARTGWYNIISHIREAVELRAKHYNSIIFNL